MAKNTFTGSITDKRTIPYNSTKTGTVSTLGKEVMGTGTLFLTECKVGDWLVDLTQNEVHQIASITDNFSMHLRDAFTADLAGASVVTTPASPRPKEISVLIPNGSADGQIDGVTWNAGIAWSSSKMNKDIQGRPDQIDPIVVDATGTVMKVQINY